MRKSKRQTLEEAKAYFEGQQAILAELAQHYRKARFLTTNTLDRERQRVEHLLKETTTKLEKLK